MDFNLTGHLVKTIWIENSRQRTRVNAYYQIIIAPVLPGKTQC